MCLQAYRYLCYRFTQAYWNCLLPFSELSWMIPEWKGYWLIPNPPTSLNINGVSSKSLKKRQKDHRMLELEAVIKSNSPHPHFANSPDTERSFEWSFESGREQELQVGLLTFHPMAHLFHSPYTVLMVVSMSGGERHDLLPVVYLTPSQYSWIVIWKTFLAWSLFNICMEKRAQKLCFGPWRKMIRSRGGYVKIWDIFIFWELLSWEGHYPDPMCGCEGSTFHIW